MKNERRIYLAGPITSLTYDESETWRDYVKAHLPENILCYSPLRGKEFLKKVGKLEAMTSDSLPPLSTPKGINTRDHFDLMNCDLVLVNLADAQIVSIGSVLEIAWAHAYRKPCVLVMEEGNIHWHAMIRECAGFIVPTLDEAIDIVTYILNP